MIVMKGHLFLRGTDGLQVVVGDLVMRVRRNVRVVSVRVGRGDCAFGEGGTRFGAGRAQPK